MKIISRKILYFVEILILKNAAQTSSKQKKKYLIKSWKFTSINPLVVELPSDEGWRSAVVGGAGVGLGLPGEQGRPLLRHRDPRGQEVHVESDRLLHHGPVVVARLAGHVGVEVGPEDDGAY